MCGDMIENISSKKHWKYLHNSEKCINFAMSLRNDNSDY